MFVHDQVPTSDFTAERAAYCMSYDAGSEQVRVVVCVFGISFQLFSYENPWGRLAAQNNNQEVKVNQSGETDPEL